MFAFPETFTVITRTVTGQDDDGNDVYGTATRTVKGAFAPSGMTVDRQGRVLVIETDQIYLQDGTEPPAVTDKIIARGVTRDIDGVADYRNPFTGWHPGPVVSLKAVTG